MSKYEELIERLENLTGPDREVDCLIAVHPLTPNSGVRKGAEVHRLLSPSIFGISGVEENAPPESDVFAYLPKTNADAYGVPCYTASIDAALTLAQSQSELIRMLQDSYSEARNSYKRASSPDTFPAIRAALLCALRAMPEAQGWRPIDLAKPISELFTAAECDYDAADPSDIGLNGVPIKHWREAYLEGCKDMANQVFKALPENTREDFQSAAKTFLDNKLSELRSLPAPPPQEVK